MSKKNKPNNYFSMQIGTVADQIVLPKDLYYENSDPTRAASIHQNFDAHLMCL